MGDAKSVAVTPRNLVEYLGPPRILQEVVARQDEVGVATGLAFTPTGGEVLFVLEIAVNGQEDVELAFG